jgi:hypothetical protein
MKAGNFPEPYDSDCEATWRHIRKQKEYHHYYYCYYYYYYYYYHHHHLTLVIVTGISQGHSDLSFRHNARYFQLDQLDVACSLEGKYEKCL